MKKILCSWLLSTTLTAIAFSQNNCSLKKNHDGIKVYTCHTDTSRFKSIIAEFTINTTLNELIRTVLDVPKYTEWQFNTVEGKSLKKISAFEQIYHTVVEAPWPVVDRDMVVRMKIQVDDLKKEASIDAESIKGILPVSDRYVRVPASYARWIIKQKHERQLQVRYTMQIDPGGSVPAWLVNWVCAQAPYQSFKDLKSILEKKR